MAYQPGAGYYHVNQATAGARLAGGDVVTRDSADLCIRVLDAAYYRCNEQWSVLSTGLGGSDTGLLGIVRDSI